MQLVAACPPSAVELSHARPVIFSAPMVRAILSGAKTQTRRVMKPQPELAIMDAESARALHVARDVGIVPDDQEARWRWRGTFWMPWPASARNASPYGMPGDLLWVRETFALVWPGDCPPENVRDNRVEYRADTGNKYPGRWPDDSGNDPDCMRWKASTRMPRWASRLTLRVTSVRSERLQDLSEDDARAESVCSDMHTLSAAASDHFENRWCRWSKIIEPNARVATQKGAFAASWESANGKTYPWKINPWVWAITFERVSP